MKAHSLFRNVAPGDYVRTTDWKVGDYQYHWHAPLTVKGRGPLRRDLDNSTFDSQGLFCQMLDSLIIKSAMIRKDPKVVDAPSS